MRRRILPRGPAEHEVGHRARHRLARPHALLLVPVSHQRRLGLWMRSPEQPAREQPADLLAHPGQIGRASGRERVCKYVWISGVSVSLKKNNTKITQDR